MTTRRDTAFHAVEVLAAGAFGVMVSEPDLRVASIGPAVLVVVVLVLQYRQSTQAWQDEVSARLQSALSLMAVDGKARATYHVVERDGTAELHYRQVVDYVPGGSGRGRRFAATEGIVGQCVTDGRQRVVNFRDAQEFTKEMSSQFGFTGESDSRPAKTRRSYLAQPVTNSRDEVLGVIYMDSDKPDAFTSDGHCLHVELVERVAQGLGDVVR
ncbi:MAG TPA: GAF domain-containing protein [Iamia sp.]|jgi:hypothetical protein|nr:GAF domain-containing protein [Iamia sp.]